MTYIIAEIGTNHNGNLGMAIELIRAAAEAGADCVKFQKRTVALLADAATLDAVFEREWNTGRKTYRQIREELEFDAIQYEQLMDAAADARVDFMVTPFDLPALDFCEELGVRQYKIASHSVATENWPLINAIASTRKPVYMSTGMSANEQIDYALTHFKAEYGIPYPLALLHCVSEYPTSDENCRVRDVAWLTRRTSFAVGYSGHELGYAPTLAAVALGATSIERHITLDMALPGFDHHFSMLPGEFAQMARAIRALEAPVRNTPTEGELATLEYVRKYQRGRHADA